MTRTEVIEKLQEIFVDLLDDPSFTLTEDTSPDTVEEWDSLLHITLMASIEAEFGIHFATEKIAETKSGKALVDAVMEELGKK